MGLIKEARLIVFVDDLDRCLPEKAIEVLEAIKLFLEVPGVVFVLGMDREVVERGIEARYGHFFRRRRQAAIRSCPFAVTVTCRRSCKSPSTCRRWRAIAWTTLWPGWTTPAGAGPAGLRARPVPQSAQVKRALNIFHLLQEIALEREKRPATKAGWQRAHRLAAAGQDGGYPDAVPRPLPALAAVPTGGADVGTRIQP